VTGGAGLTVTPGTAALTLTAFAPSVTASDNVTVTPGTLALTLTAFAPVVTGGGEISSGGKAPRAYAFNHVPRPWQRS
jgi:hypothetical protein